MKKSILAVAVLLGATTTFAQDDKVYTPETDDWAIGIDATPFLNYFGNLIGGNDGNTAPSWNYLTTNQTITGKLFVSEDMAYRASIRLGFGSTKGTDMVADRNQDPATIQFPSTEPAMVENNWKLGSTNIGIGGGIEYRRGHGRLQGFYGGELGLNFNSSKWTFEYGNALDQDAAPGINVDVDAADDMGVGNLSTDVWGNASRVTEAKQGMTIGIGLRGFIGAEYFVLPKISVGGEFGWGLAFQKFGDFTTTMESEGINGGGNEEATTSTQTAVGGSAFGFDTDNVNSVFGPAGTLRMTFHF